MGGSVPALDRGGAVIGPGDDGVVELALLFHGFGGVFGVSLLRDLREDKARRRPARSPALQGSLPLSSKAHRVRAMKSL